MRASRYLFKRFRPSKTTISGKRITRQYNGKGSYQDALRDFESFHPTGTKAFTKSKYLGKTGRVGNYRITTRSGSSGPGNPPTLEIIRGDKTVVRKFRYLKE